jgi:hypothetical protein
VDEHKVTLDDTIDRWMPEPRSTVDLGRIGRSTI